jgi:nucleotide-binding universal stress UspA family protein
MMIFSFGLMSGARLAARLIFSPEGVHVPGPVSSDVGKLHRVLTRDSEGCSMFRSILVPLDCSPFAERALTLALGIARRAGARLDLVTVHVSYYPEESIPRGTHIDPEREAERRRQEQAYLDETSARAAAAGIAVTAAVLPGSAVSPSVLADSILERADAGQVDLIVMATHARGAFGRLAAGGSVADELVRRANIPVLLVRPDQPAPATAPEPAFDPILIPLNGSAAAERVLGPALDLARLMQACCVLLRVVVSRPPAAGQPLSTPPEVPQAEAYLADVGARVSGQGVQVRTLVVVAPDAAEAILAQADGQECGLVALAGQGHTRLGRLVLGSTAEKIILGVRSPVLAYRSSDGGC